MKIAPTIFPGLRPTTQEKLVRDLQNADPMKILLSICLALDIPMKELCSKSRERELVEARTIAVGLILLYEKSFTLKRLGVLLGGRHHSSIIHLRQTFDNLYKRDKPFTKKVQEVLKHV